MGSFIFYNYNADISKAKTILKSKGHKQIETFSIDRGILLTTNKILVNNKNYVKFDNGDFIAGYGNFFYKKAHGIKAIELIFNEFNLEKYDLPFPVYGHYAFIIHKGTKTVIFNDKAGTFRLYYKNEDNNVCISSSVLSVSSSINNPKFDDINLAAYLGGSFMSEQPVIEGVKNLNTFKIAVFEDGKFSLVKKNNKPSPKRIDNLDEAVNHVTKLIDEQIEQWDAIRDETLSQELTGGLDSRLLACILTRGKFDFDFISYPLFGPDSKIARIVSSVVNKKLIIEENPPITNEEECWGEFDTCFNYYRHYPSQRWTIPHKFQFSGLFGECLATEDGISQFKAGKAYLSDIVKAITVGPYVEKGMRDKLINRNMNYFEEIGIPNDKPLTELQLSVLTHEMLPKFTGDCLFVSGQNAHLFFYSIYNEWNFVNGVSHITMSVREGRKLSIAMIKHLNKKLADLPFVSRRRTKRNSVSSINSLPVVNKSYNKIKALLPNILVDFLYKRLGRIFSNEKLSQIDFSYYKNVVNINMLKKYPNLYSGILNRMYSLEIIRKKLGF